MNFKMVDTGFACIDFFFCGWYYAQNDIKKTILFGVLGLILYLSFIWR